jgi:hypothetical protein
LPETFLFLRRILNLMKTRPIGVELHADGRTDGQAGRQMDMMKLRVAFQNFLNAPVNAK